MKASLKRKATIVTTLAVCAGSVFVLLTLIADQEPMEIKIVAVTNGDKSRIDGKVTKQVALAEVRNSSSQMIFYHGLHLRQTNLAFPKYRLRFLNADQWITNSASSVLFWQVRQFGIIEGNPDPPEIDQVFDLIHQPIMLQPGEKAQFCVALSETNRPFALSVDCYIPESNNRLVKLLPTWLNQRHPFARTNFTISTPVYDPASANSR